MWIFNTCSKVWGLQFFPLESMKIQWHKKSLFKAEYLVFIVGINNGNQSITRKGFWTKQTIYTFLSHLTFKQAYVHPDTISVAEMTDSLHPYSLCVSPLPILHGQIFYPPPSFFVCLGPSVLGQIGLCISPQGVRNRLHSSYSQYCPLGIGEWGLEEACLPCVHVGQLMTELTLNNQIASIKITPNLQKEHVLLTKYYRPLSILYRN